MSRRSVPSLALCAVTSALAVPVAAQSDRAIALLGDVAPGSGGTTFTSLGPPVMNESGDVAAPGTLFVPGNTPAILVEESGMDRVVARRFDPLPAPLVGVFNGFPLDHPPLLDDAGDVYFEAFSGVGAPGIFVDSGATISVVVFDGDPAPDTGGGTYDGFLDQGFDVDSSGRVFFVATVASGIASAGIFVDEGLGGAALALDGDAAPDTGGGTFAAFPTPPAENDQGAIAFEADLSGGSASNGIFYLPEPGAGSLPAGICLVAGLGGRRVRARRRASVLLSTAPIARIRESRHA